MEREALVKEWFQYAQMDLASAKVLMEIMCPAPLEIICCHCQQTAEKVLKGLPVTLKMMSRRPMILRGVRYPQECVVDAQQTMSAIAQAEKVKAWAESQVA